VKERELIY